MSLGLCLRTPDLWDVFFQLSQCNSFTHARKKQLENVYSELIFKFFFIKVREAAA